MTETYTSRNKLHRLIGQLSHDYACDLEREASDVITALLARAEKAEAERDDLLALHGEDMALCNQLEAERDTAWNDALDAAADHFMGGDITEELNALKKGDTP